MRRNHSGRVGVIGGGLGGLAAACTLAARGYEVVLLERNAWLGGKAAVLEGDGYRFDMGPTILLMPSVLARLFAESGRDPREALDRVPLDPQWRSFFDDGATLDLHAESVAMREALGAFAPGRGLERGYGRFLDLAARLRDISDRFFFWRSVGSLRDMFDARSAIRPAVLGDVLAMRPWSTVGATVRSHMPEARVAQMLDHFTQYVGSAPDLSPAVLCGIAQMQTGEGVWYPRGGTRAIPALCRWLSMTLDKIGGLGNCSFSEPVESPPIFPIRRRLDDQCHADQSTNIGMTQYVLPDASIDTAAPCDNV